MSALRIFMVAGEASGDLLAREVVEAIRQKGESSRLSASTLRLISRHYLFLVLRRGSRLMARL